MRFLAVALALFACVATAQEAPFKVLPGFSADLDGVCGLGQDLEAGCDAIRARAILDAAEPPWQAVGRVNVAGALTRSHCTGTLIAPGVVLTAAHCLRDDAGMRVLVQDVTFVAGYQRGTGAGIGNAASLLLGDAESASVPANDWALILLDAPLAIDPMPLAVNPQQDSAITLTGYSALRPHVLSQAECGLLGPIRSGLNQSNCPAMPGDSGAPITIQQDGTPKVAAILSSIVTDDGRLATLLIPVGAIALAAGLSMPAPQARTPGLATRSDIAALPPRNPEPDRETAPPVLDAQPR